jgi:hypothetical protein
MGAKLLRILKTLAALGRGTALILVAAGLVASPSASAREAGEVLQPADSIEGNFLAGTWPPPPGTPPPRQPITGRR